MFNDYSYLYVEDDPLSREVMQMMMENAMGVTRLTIFEDSQNFIERVEALPEAPTLFMLDIHVPPYDGFEMLRMLRNHPRFQGAKIIALTASVMNEEVMRLREVGFDGAIGKPLNLQQFPALIQRVLDGENIWHIA